MKYYIDGFTLGGNPGHGGGYTIVNEYGDLIEQKTHYKQGYTNNEGEVHGLKRAIQIAKQGDIISTDSQNNLYWLCSGSSETRKDLNDLLSESKSLLNGSEIKIIWERREYNLAGILNENKVITKEDIDKSKNAEIEFSNEIKRTLERLDLISEGKIVVRVKKGWRVTEKPKYSYTQMDLLGLPIIEEQPVVIKKKDVSITLNHEEQKKSVKKKEKKNITLVQSQFIARNRRLKRKKMTYDEFLKSRKWKETRDYLKKFPEYQSCTICSKTTNIDLHHMTYTKMFKPGLKRHKQTICALCRTCHGLAHSMCNEKGYGLRQVIKLMKKEYNRAK